MVGKTKRRQKSATKIHVRRPVTRSVSRTRRHQEDSPTPPSQGHRSDHSSGSSSRRMSSSSVTKTVSSFDSRRMNVLVTNSEQPPLDDNMALRIQQLEQGQQRIEVLTLSSVHQTMRKFLHKMRQTAKKMSHAPLLKRTLTISSLKQKKMIH